MNIRCCSEGTASREHPYGSWIDVHNPSLLLPAWHGIGPGIPYLSLRNPIEPEFSVREHLHNMNQFVADSVKYELTSAQLFYTPVPRPQGWMLIIWDMVKRVMKVLDPLYIQKCAHPPSKERDEAIAWKLHHALFNYLTEFYAGWPTMRSLELVWFILPTTLTATNLCCPLQSTMFPKQSGNLYTSAWSSRGTSPVSRIRHYGAFLHRRTLRSTSSPFLLPHNLSGCPDSKWTWRSSGASNPL